MKIEYKGKWFPEAGTKVTVHHYMTGTCSPYTVSRVEGGKVVVRTCGMKFNGARYYDTLPDEIYDDPEGSERTLTWSPKRKNWVMSDYPGDKHPGVAEFNVWRYEPYLDLRRRSMASKYDELSGEGGILTVTPYGLLMDILLYQENTKVYLASLNRASVDDKFSWYELNKGLYDRLKEMSEYMSNIIMVADDLKTELPKLERKEDE